MMHLFQLQVIEIIQSYRSSWLDTFFIFWNFFDTFWFFILFLPLVWLFSGWKAGIKISYLFLFSSFANVFIKAFFSLPRPYQIKEGIQILNIPGYGFPSGAAQTAIIILILSYKYWKYRSVLFGSLAFFLLLSFSRIYLGVHFFTDILGGWAVGAFICLIYKILQPFISHVLVSISKFYQILLIILPPLLISCLLDVDPRVIKYIPVFVGHGIATYLAYHNRSLWAVFKSPRAKGLGYATALIGIGLLYNIQYTFSELRQTPMKEAFMGLYSIWGLFGAFALCHLLFFRKNRVNNP